MDARIAASDEDVLAEKVNLAAVLIEILEIIRRIFAHVLNFINGNRVRFVAHVVPLKFQKNKRGRKYHWDRLTQPRLPVNPLRPRVTGPPPLRFPPNGGAGTI